MYICIDFDGTIVKHEYPAIGPDVPGAFKYIRKFQEAGAKIILHTMRGGVELLEAVEHIYDHGIELYGINANPDQTWTTSKKVWGNLYIDDAAFGCPLIQDERPYVDWHIVGPKVMEMLNG